MPWTVFFSVFIIEPNFLMKNWKKINYRYNLVLKTDKECESSADYGCLQEKLPKEIVDCAWGEPMLTADGPSNICKCILSIPQIEKIDYKLF